MVALSESVVSADEAALDTESFRARALGCRGLQSRFRPLSQHSGHSQLFGKSSLTVMVCGSSPIHSGCTMSKHIEHSTKLDEAVGVGFPVSKIKNEVSLLITLTID